MRDDQVRPRDVRVRDLDIDAPAAEVVVGQSGEMGDFRAERPLGIAEVLAGLVVQDVDDAPVEGVGEGGVSPGFMAAAGTGAVRRWPPVYARAVFLEDELREGRDFTHRPETEKGHCPDFVFPSAEKYAGRMFPETRLRMLAVKTTCNDRWRQVLNQAAWMGSDGAPTYCARHSLQRVLASLKPVERRKAVAQFHHRQRVTFAVGA